MPQVCFTLEATPAAVRTTRRRISAAIRSWGVPLDQEQRTGLDLVSSELLTNALLHAGGRLTARVALEAHLVVIEVLDDSGVLPRHRDTGPDDERGRGLTIIDALCLLHGAHPTATGKRCYAVLPLHGPAHDAPREAPHDSSGRDSATDSSAHWSLTPIAARLLTRLLPTEQLAPLAKG